MEQFFHRLHERRESAKKANMTKKEQWREDETEVRHGSCGFPIKYLGYTEVFESKGTDICRQSFHKLKYDEGGYSLANAFKKNKRRQSTGSRHYATLQISSCEVRIIDENEDILVETPISSISFCCPNSHHERGFTYICRGDVPLKWHCHAMEAVEDHGERLNHAIGCAFSVCVEKKILAKRQGADKKMESDSATAAAEAGNPTAPIPRRSSDNATLPVDRPIAPEEYKDRKGSLGGLMAAHPYKRITQKGAHPVHEEEDIELRQDLDKD